MSFTSTVKNEVSKLETLEAENISELSAIIRNVGEITDVIKISTENSSVARRIFNLIKDIYDINAKIIVRKGYNFNKNYIYYLEVSYKNSIISMNCGTTTKCLNNTLSEFQKKKERKEQRNI